MKTLLILSVLLASFAHSATPSVQSPLSPYRLGVVIVIDQLRADTLMRFKSDFLPPSELGLRFLMERGAYFPLADHGLFQNMTCPGHAAVMSGAYPYRHGIPMNNWYDRKKQKTEYCVRDESKKIIAEEGVLDNGKGISPQYFNATTVGDELKNVDRASRVVSIALKDRAAVMLGGKRADHSYWMNDKTCGWITSEYYGSQLPAWVLAQNKSIRELNSKKLTWGPYTQIDHCSRSGLQTPWTAEKTFDLALSAQNELGLGKGKDIDLLLTSLSSHDYLGHQLGPNSPHMRTMTLAEDHAISRYLKTLASRVPGGIDSLFVVVTGDHGIPPTPGSLPAEKIPNGNIDSDELQATLEKVITDEWGKPKGGAWIEKMYELQIYLSQQALESEKINSEQVLNVLRKKWLPQAQAKGIETIWSRDQILLDRKRPAGDLGDIADHTFNAKSGDLLLVVKPFYFSDDSPLTHMTHYSYDRYVPMIVFGKTFKAGTYPEIIRVIDLAPTLSQSIGVIPPAQSEGRVLKEIMKSSLKSADR